MSTPSEDEARVRHQHSTREGFINILGAPMCIECEDVWPCVEIRALDALCARNAELVAALERVVALGPRANSGYYIATAALAGQPIAVPTEPLFGNNIRHLRTSLRLWRAVRLSGPSVGDE